MDVKGKIVAWRKLSSQLKSAKKREMELRIEIVSFFDSELTIGTNNFHEFGIKIAKKQNIKVNEDEFHDAFAEMTDDEQDCFKLKPTLVLSKYKEIDSDAIDAILVSVPAAPTLSIIK